MFRALGAGLGGAALLLRGLNLLLRRSRLFLLGAIPPLITSVLFVTALVLLLVNLGDVVTWLTPFATDWAETWQAVLRVAIGAALVGGTVFLFVIAFTSITLALGSPIYDHIAERVEDELADPPAEVPESRVRSLLRGLTQSLVIIAVSVLVSVAVLLTGFLPLVGAILAPVLSLLLGGWVLAVELLGPACDRRGWNRIGDRLRLMRRDRARVLGFAIPTFALLAVPVLAILVFPAAAAGGTLLARELLNSPESP